MNLLRRAAGILTWRHFAWIFVIVVAWNLSERVGMTYNTVDDGTTLESMVRDVTLGLAFACVYLAAIVIVEAASDGRPGMARYVLGVVAAGLVTMTLAYTGFVPPEPVVSMPARSDVETLAQFEKRRSFVFQRAEALASGRLSAPRERLRLSARAVALFTLVSFAYVWLRRSREARQWLEEAELARSEAQRKLLAERLSSAQAAVDPSGILERLTEIEQAYERDPPRAAAMMDELTRFLRQAIPGLRIEASHEAQGHPG